MPQKIMSLPNIKEVDSITSSKKQMMVDLANVIAKELINPKYTIETRRSESIVKKEYIDLMDNWFDKNYSHQTYPKNSRGSLARIDASAVEFYVNIPQLYKQYLKATSDSKLKSKLQDIEKKEGLSKIRDIFVKALSEVGKKDYEVEWNHELTREKYDEDLNKITNCYFIGNEKIKEEVTKDLEIWKKQEPKKDFIILDIGVGIGGTTLPIIEEIAKQVKEKKISDNDLLKIKFILADIDPLKVNQLKKFIIKKYKISAENLIPAVGEFSHLKTILKEYQGKINEIISGLAICHSCEKQELFKDIHHLLNPQGKFLNCDQFIPLFYSPYLKVSQDKEMINKKTVLIYGKNKIKKEVLDSHQKLSENSLVSQKNGEKIKITTEISNETALRFAALAAFIYVPQLGFKEGVEYFNTKDCKYKKFTHEEGYAMCIKAWEYIQEKMNSADGFSFFEYIAWLCEQYKHLIIPQAERSKYQLIEALESTESYQNYAKKAGLKVENFQYLYPVISKMTPKESQNAVLSGVGVMMCCIN